MAPYMGNIPLQTFYFCTLAVFRITGILLGFKTLVWGQSYIWLWPALSSSEYVKYIIAAYELS